MITRSSKKINNSIVTLPDVDTDYNPVDNINEHRVLFKGNVHLNRLNIRMNDTERS